MVGNGNKVEEGERMSDRAQENTDASGAGEQTLRVTRAGEAAGETAQTAAAHRITGVGKTTGATKIWFGRVATGAGEWSGAHHHGEAETGGYVLSGHGRIYYGEDYKEYVDLEEGDFVFVPPYLPHIEGNMSDTEELVWLTTRAPDNIVVNLEDSVDRERLGKD
jgi:uncharacterized RmlC-like cupin family protein